MKKHLLFFIAVSLVTIGAPLVSHQSAHAVESFGVGAVPANPDPNNPRTKSIFIFTATPNKPQQNAVKVINNSPDKKTVKVYPVDSVRSSDGAFACAQAADTPKEVGRWLSLSKTEVTLAANTSETIPFSLTVPESAGVGEHNGCIAIQEIKAPEASGQNGITLSFRSALRVAVIVPGDVQALLRFTNLTTQQNGTTIVTSAVLNNAGNVSVDATVHVQLYDVIGLKAGDIEGQFAILTKDDTNINFELPAPFWGGIYRAVSHAHYKQLNQLDDGSTKHESVDGPTKWVVVTPQPLALLVYSGLLVILIGSAVWWAWQRKQYRLLHADATKHVVVEGDSLQTLSKASGASWKDIARLNKLRAPYSLEVGSTIRIPNNRPKVKPTKANSWPHKH